MTVIVIGAIVLTIGVSAVFVAQSEVIMTGHADRGAYAFALATSCLDEAVYRLKRDPAYPGGTVQIGGDSCTAAVSGSGSSRTVDASATYDGHTRTIRAVVTLLQNTAGNARAWRIGSWTELAP